MRYKLFLGLFLAWASVDAFSQALLLTDAGNTSVQNHLYYWCDTTNSATIENVKEINFKPVEWEEPNFGFDNRAYWFKIDIKNQIISKANKIEQVGWKEYQS